MTSPKFDPLVDAKYQAFLANGLTAQDPAGLKTWVASARASILSQINPLDTPSFGLAATSINATNDAAVITGVAPVQITTLKLNGQPWIPTWLSPTGFSLRLPVGPGTTTWRFTTA